MGTLMGLIGYPGNFLELGLRICWIYREISWNWDWVPGKFLGTFLGYPRNFFGGMGYPRNFLVEWDTREISWLEWDFWRNHTYVSLHIYISKLYIIYLDLRISILISYKIKISKYINIYHLFFSTSQNTWTSQISSKHLSNWLWVISGQVDHASNEWMTCKLDPTIYIYILGMQWSIMRSNGFVSYVSWMYWFSVLTVDMIWQNNNVNSRVWNSRQVTLQ